MLYAPGAALADQAFADLKIPHRIFSLPDGSLLFLCTGTGLHFNMQLRPDGQALLWRFLGEAPPGQEGRLEYRAGDCTACGACEANCPFGVSIAQRMEETAALFGA